MRQHLHAAHFSDVVTGRSDRRRRRFHARLVKFAGKALDLGVFLFDAASQGIDYRLRLLLRTYQIRYNVLEFMIEPEVADGLFPGDGLDPSNTRGNAALMENLDQANLAGCKR